ncbi:unnamed protein product [Linum trigynum]|uniref:Uncharacterized protein n=1 Tax=Linum trigynum TaxID=586398 RepID=A0AAV2CQT2_9ROSI
MEVKASSSPATSRPSSLLLRLAAASSLRSSLPYLNPSPIVPYLIRHCQPFVVAFSQSNPSSSIPLLPPDQIPPASIRPQSFPTASAAANHSSSPSILSRNRILVPFLTRSSSITIVVAVIPYFSSFEHTLPPSTVGLLDACSSSHIEVFISTEESLYSSSNRGSPYYTPNRMEVITWI